MNAPTIKVERENSQDNGRIKTEDGSAGASPSALSDDDMYEDTGELDMSNPEKLYLMRLPTWLYERWSTIDSEEPSNLGVVRVQNESDNNRKVQSIFFILPMLFYKRAKLFLYF